MSTDHPTSNQTQHLTKNRSQNPPQFDPVPLTWLCGFLAVAFLGGALLAPAMHAGIAALAAEYSWWREAAEHPFHRYVNRCIQFLALASLWPVTRLQRIRSSEFGWRTPVGEWTGIGATFLFGSIVIGAALLAVAATQAPAATIPPGVAQWLQLLLKALAGALLIGFVEEFLFRGFFHSMFSRAFAPPLALLFGSVLFASVHLLQPVRHAGEVHWWTGLSILSQMIGSAPASSATAATLVSLTAAGLVLGMVRNHTGSLWYAIALHAGWVFGLKIFRALSGPLPEANSAFWGSDAFFDGWLSVVMALCTLAVLPAFLRGLSPASAPGQRSRGWRLIRE